MKLRDLGTVSYMYLAIYFNLKGPPGPHPPDPIGPPRLIPDRTTGRAGQFIVDLSNAAPQPQEDESIDRSTISSVTFLFRFEEVNTSNVSFNWTVSKCMLNYYYYQSIISLPAIV